ncbi:MAG: hypothetical protein Aurels2KO_48130 [Aureliella sp.]
MSDLRTIFDRHHCDRGHRHGYELIYEKLLRGRRHDELRILEIGVFEGRGIRSWLDYFANVSIAGIDTFERVPIKDLTELENNNGVSLLECNSTVPEDVARVLGGHTFDLIFDDGAHDPMSQRSTFQNLFPLLADDGHYFIEDVWPIDHLGEWQQSEEYQRLDPIEFSAESYRALVKVVSEHSPLFHDVRKQHGDSYIISVSKKNKSRNCPIRTVTESLLDRRVRTIVRHTD